MGNTDSASNDPAYSYDAAGYVPGGYTSTWTPALGGLKLAPPTGGYWRKEQICTPDEWPRCVIAQPNDLSIWEQYYTAVDAASQTYQNGGMDTSKINPHVAFIPACSKSFIAKAMPVLVGGVLAGITQFFLFDLIPLPLPQTTHSALLLTAFATGFMWVSTAENSWDFFDPAKKTSQVLSLGLGYSAGSLLGTLADAGTVGELALGGALGAVGFFYVAPKLKLTFEVGGMLSTLMFHWYTLWFDFLKEPFCNIGHFFSSSDPCMWRNADANPFARYWDPLSFAAAMTDKMIAEHDIQRTDHRTALIFDAWAKNGGMLFAGYPDVQGIDVGRWGQDSPLEGPGDGLTFPWSFPCNNEQCWASPADATQSCIPAKDFETLYPMLPNWKKTIWEKVNVPGAQKQPLNIEGLTPLQTGPSTPLQQNCAVYITQLMAAADVQTRGEIAFTALQPKFACETRDQFITLWGNNYYHLLGDVHVAATWMLKNTQFTAAEQAQLLIAAFQLNWGSQYESYLAWWSTFDPSLNDPTNVWINSVVGGFINSPVMTALNQIKSYFQQGLYTGSLPHQFVQNFINSTAYNQATPTQQGQLQCALFATATETGLSPCPQTWSLCTQWAQTPEQLGGCATMMLFMVDGYDWEGCDVDTIKIAATHARYPFLGGSIAG